MEHTSTPEPQFIRLKLIKSPTVEHRSLSDSDASAATPQRREYDIRVVDYADRIGFPDRPKFQRHDEATNPELFFDLFFAANITVFRDVHSVTDKAKLVSYVGYFCILWFTWALVGMYDVRFLTDSIFERLAIAGHLGVMIGFVVVAGTFDPGNQVRETLKTMSLIITVSRLLLAVQYASILWHVRKYDLKETKLPFMVLAGIHFAAALIYLGLAFAFSGYNNNLYIVWYVVAIVETAFNVGLSLRFDVLSFAETHLVNRMALLTLIIIGEGIVVVCTNIAAVVDLPNSWTPVTIGLVTSAVCIMYFVWMIYNDWKRQDRMPVFRLLCWSFIHLPFHLVLTLFVEGSSQFIIWGKIIEAKSNFASHIEDDLSEIPLNVGAEDVKAWYISTLNVTIQKTFDLYPTDLSSTYDCIKNAFLDLNNLTENFYQDRLVGNTSMPDNLELKVFNESISSILLAVSNSIFATFNWNTIGDAQNIGDNSYEIAKKLNHENWQLFDVVFLYTFACAGITLTLMNLLSIISKIRPWTPLNILRHTLSLVLAIGLALCPLITLNAADDAASAVLPWKLPTICTVFFLILVLNHLPGIPQSRFEI